MNKYGQLALSHWQKWRPSAYSQIPDPETFFSDLGEQIETQVQEIEAATLANQPSQSDYLDRVGQLNMARLAAQEQVLAEMAYLPPEPGTDPSDPEDPQDPSEALVDDEGMPTDRSHQLWEAQDDPEVSPEEFRTMLQTFHRQVKASSSQQND